MVLLMQGWDDRLLLAYLHKSAVPSDVDTSIWRNCASLRVRYLATTMCPSGSWRLDDDSESHDRLVRWDHLGGSTPNSRRRHRTR